ncbi:hypothetical protein LP420_26720 [Massilia sp. B-10]|nr:hypothetical protein LP420_26720 [Massilia sp. B-10]
MEPLWKAVCRVRDLSQKAHRVARGLAWQELPGVQVLRTDDDQVVAYLEGDGARAIRYRVEGDRVLLDLNELNAPASRAEAALA